MQKKLFNISLTVAILLAIAGGLTFYNGTQASAKSVSSQNDLKLTNSKSLAASEKLTIIDEYQSQYFTIVKRNNLFWDTSDFDAIKKDKEELDKLFKKVEKRITNKCYLKKYNEIEKRYSKCEDTTTPGIIEFESKNYEEIDTLLNEVYSKVKTKLSPEDFKKLAESETKWLKEVENYDTRYNEFLNITGAGTIRAIIYYEYQINMRNFRTLLLMLYL